MATVWGRGYAGLYRSLILACFMGSLCCIAALAGCKGDPAGAGEPNTSRAPIRVRTLTIQAGEASRIVTLSGFTEPIRRAAPAARIMSKVVEAGFLEGDQVEENRILIRLDTRDLRARKREALASLETASATLEISRLNLTRMRNLHASQSVSRHQMETVEVAASQAEAAREAARAAVEDLDVTLSYARACAPFSGVVVRKMVEVGNMVAPGQQLFIIEDDSSLRVVAPVGTDLAVGIRPGDTLTVRIEGQGVKGTVEGIVSSGSTSAPGQRVQLIVGNRDHRFRAGTLAAVEVPQGGEKATGICVPKDSLVEKGRLTGAYVVAHDKTAWLHWLVTGRDTGGGVSVISGLKSGDRVVISPEQAGVRDGSVVEEATR